MAQGSEGFKLITVNQDEDDVVIHAGIREDASADSVLDDAFPCEDHFQDALAQDDAWTAENFDDAGVDEPNDEACEGDDWLTEEESAPAPSKRKKWDGYETTAEDLVGTPMPVAQKATIIGGLALLVFAIGYCVFFM